MRSLTQGSFITSTIRRDGVGAKSVRVTLTRRPRDKQAYFPTIAIGSCLTRDGLVALWWLCWDNMTFFNPSIINTKIRKWLIQGFIHLRFNCKFGIRTLSLVVVIGACHTNHNTFGAPYIHQNIVCSTNWGTKPWRRWKSCPVRFCCCWFIIVIYLYPYHYKYRRYL